MNNRQQSGFTMIEVLVAAIIMMVSLLGMGALQSTSMKKNTSAMNKTQAMESMNYMGDALRSQWSTIADNDEGVLAVYNRFTADFWGSSNYQSNFVDSCGSGCNREVMAKHMLAEWERMIGEQLPKGQGKIERIIEDKKVDGTNVQTTYYKVTIMWDDRQMAINGDGSKNTLGTGCSGNPKVDLTCYVTLIHP